MSYSQSVGEVEDGQAVRTIAQVLIFPKACRVLGLRCVSAGSSTKPQKGENCGGMASATKCQGCSKFSWISWILSQIHQAVQFEGTSINGLDKRWYHLAVDRKGGTFIL